MEGAGSTAPGPAQEIAKLEQALKSGAHWFYWIAGLSLVNSVIQLLGSDRSFIVGLGVTQVVDAIAKAGSDDAGGVAATVIRGIALLIDLFVAGIFVLLGWQAGKRRGWAFVVGIVLYLLDGLIFLLVQDWMSLAFHAFALFGLWTGYSSLRKLRVVEQQAGLRPIGPGA
jgi:hypothetical protein